MRFFTNSSKINGIDSNSKRPCLPVSENVFIFPDSFCDASSIMGTICFSFVAVKVGVRVFRMRFHVSSRDIKSPELIGGLGLMKGRFLDNNLPDYFWVCDNSHWGSTKTHLLDSTITTCTRWSWESTLLTDSMLRAKGSVRITRLGKLCFYR